MSFAWSDDDGDVKATETITWPFHTLLPGPADNHPPTITTNNSSNSKTQERQYSSDESESVSDSAMVLLLLLVWNLVCGGDQMVVLLHY